MSLVTITNKTLEKLTGHESIPEIFVTIAKMSVMLGSETADIARQLGVGVESIREVELTQIYKDIRLILSVKHAEEKIDRDISYDSLETMALERLVKQVPFEKDTDVLLRIATMANRATRRTAPSNDIVPQSGAAKVPLRLSERIVRKINGDGSAEETRERSVSVLDGGAKNPSFERVEGFFAGAIQESQDVSLDTPSDVQSSQHESTVDLTAVPRPDSRRNVPTGGSVSASGGSVSATHLAPAHGNLQMSPREKLAMLAKKALGDVEATTKAAGESS